MNSLIGWSWICNNDCLTMLYRILHRWLSGLNITQYFVKWKSFLTKQITVTIQKHHKKEVEKLAIITIHSRFF